MQLIADTSGLTVHVPNWREVPARGSALFGAVAAGVYEDIDAAIEATRPSESKTYTPDMEAKEVYDRVYAIYRTLYESLGRSDVELLHGLKRIRAERGAD
jgi:L-ribulokinase